MLKKTYTSLLINKIFLLLIIFVSNQAYAADMRQHPYHGKWVFVFQGCKEIYTVLPDNTAFVTSGEEIGKSNYQISDIPDMQGFYHITDTVADSNGKTGCDGESGGSQIGHTVKAFIKFNQEQDQMLWCFDKSEDQCMGPFYRQPQD